MTGVEAESCNFSRNVFGNVAEHAELPSMPLGGMYVEPDAGNKTVENQPVLGLLEKLIGEHPVVVLQADFGHGKGPRMGKSIDSGSRK